MQRQPIPLLSLSAALLALADSIEPQSESVLGRENAEFARRLYENGYADLATGLCRTIKAGQADGAELLGIEALEFDLQVEEIRRNPDLLARKTALRDVIERENAFLAENARTKVADVVRDGQPGLYLEYAQALTAALAREEDPTKSAELIREGEELFVEGEESLRQRIERFTSQIDEGTGNLAYAERQLQFARFSLARMDYHHSLLYSDEAKRNERLEAAVEAFGDFGFDYADTLQNYQGIIYQGLCHEALGKDEDALIDYEDAVALRELFVVEEGLYQVGPEEADIVSGATLRRMLLLLRLKRHAEAAAVAADFFATVPDALATSSGQEVLAAKAEAEIAAGDAGAAGTTAQELVELDPQGWAGRTGRELLARLPVVGLPPDRILRIAETSVNRGNFSRALDLLRRAREGAAGTGDEAEVGAASFFLAGRAYGYQQLLHEASQAYDCAAELYPSGSKAPEALNAAVNIYRELARNDRSRFYSRRADERMNTLARKYPQHPLAANAGIWQGVRREDEGDFAGAIEFYSKIPADSPTYQEATLRLADATYRKAKLVLQQGERAAAKPGLEQAEQQYRAALEVQAQAQQVTMDPQLLQRYAGYALAARLGLAALLLDLERAPEVSPLLEGLDDERQGLSPEMVAQVWSLRIRALEAQGKLDDATAMFEALAERSPDAPGLASAAGVLARALDRAASTLFETDASSPRAEELWRKAAQSYWLSVKSGLDGTSALRSDEVSDVAQRLYVIGLFFNEVPEGQQTFVDWQGQVVDPGPWQGAARIYERLDEQAPSYRISIERARTLALLGELAAAERIYARLFDQNPILAQGQAGNGFDRAVIDARPELVSAYLEWGVATNLVGLATNDPERLDRASGIYARMLENTTPSSRTWWQAKYYQIKSLADRGDYELADTAIRNTKRTTDPRYDRGEFGFEPKFAALEAEVGKKVFK